VTAFSHRDLKQCVQCPHRQCHRPPGGSDRRPCHCPSQRPLQSSDSSGFLRDVYAKPCDEGLRWAQFGMDMTAGRVVKRLSDAVECDIVWPVQSAAFCRQEPVCSAFRAACLDLKAEHMVWSVAASKSTRLRPNPNGHVPGLSCTS
jgi:hypothetical protein